MKPLIFLILASLGTIHAVAQPLDEEKIRAAIIQSATDHQALLREAKAWKPGQPLPQRLLDFPTPPAEALSFCLTANFGSHLEDYLLLVDNPPLWEALFRDARTQPDTLNAAAWQLLSTRGPAYVAGILATDLRVVRNPTLAALAENLRSSYASLEVAMIENKDMPTPAAEKALAELRHELEAGRPWKEAYSKISARHPDLTRRAKGLPGTLTRYHYSGLVSPACHDLLRPSTLAPLPSEHLRALFRTRPRTAIFHAPDGVYLYYVKAYYEGSSPSATDSRPQ